MKKENNKISPEISKATKLEITQTKKFVRDKYDIDVPNSDAIKLVGLIKELNWWMKLDQKKSVSTDISDEVAQEYLLLVERSLNNKITLTDARKSAHDLLTLVPYKEKERISNEIRAILVIHRRVLRSDIVIEKLTQLLSLRYDFVLSGDQLEQLIQFLSKKLWFEIGLDESLETCLDELLIYADKQKRGKRVTGYTDYVKIIEVLDETINKF